VSDRFSALPTLPELRTPDLVLREMNLDDAGWYLRHFSAREAVEGSGFPAPANAAGAEGELHELIVGLFARPRRDQVRARAARRRAAGAGKGAI
jgi:hypothetical protein